MNQKRLGNDTTTILRHKLLLKSYKYMNMNSTNSPSQRSDGACRPPGTPGPPQFGQQQQEQQQHQQFGESVARNLVEQQQQQQQLGNEAFAQLQAHTALLRENALRGALGYTGVGAGSDGSRQGLAAYHQPSQPLPSRADLQYLLSNTRGSADVASVAAVLASARAVDEATVQRRLEQLLAAQGPNEQSAPAPSYNLQRLLAERAMRQQSSIDEATRLTRLKELESLRLQQALYGAAGLAANSNQLLVQQDQLIQPRLFASNLEQSLRMLHPPAPAPPPEACDPRKRKVPAKTREEDCPSIQKKKPRRTSVSPAHFPLPHVKESGEDPTDAKLASYHKLWDKLGKANNSSLQRELFRRRLQSNKLHVTGTTRSLVLKADRKEEEEMLGNEEGA